MSYPLFVDSGAFSAWSKGAVIDIDEYCEFLKAHPQIKNYACLDVIGDPDASLANQNYMVEQGLEPVPCFHTGEDYSYLQHYVDNYEYIALGGMVGGAMTTSSRTNWLDTVFGNYVCHEDGMPRCKVHGFGMTSWRLMRRYPWFSVDSTSWLKHAATGGIYVAQKRHGKFRFDRAPHNVLVSGTNDKGLRDGTHISTLSKRVRLQFEEYLDMFGFLEQDYMNEYRVRFEINCLFFARFAASMPVWPWQFEHMDKCGGLF